MARSSGLLIALGVLLVAAAANAQGPFGGYGPGNGNYDGQGGRFGGDGNGCGWWGGSNCNGKDDNSDGSSSTDPSSRGLSQSEINRNSRIVTIHAVLASMVWVL